MSGYPEESIGNGTYGQVFQLVGHDPSAVIKYVMWYNDESRRHYEAECDALQKCDHPNIVHLIRIHEVENSTRLGLVMEYCDRGSLKTMIFNSTIIYTIRSVISWSQQLFGALDYMYQTFNIIHRDIKPTNIFVTNDFTLKVGDFGLAKVAVETMSGTFIGSYRYMSPTRPDYDARASHLHDIYAMGLVVWELIERRAVWSEYEADGEFRYHFFLYSFFEGHITELATPNCQSNLQQIIKRCTNFDRRSRPKADEVCQQLAALPRLEHQDIHPTIDESSQVLIRPVGFDDTDERQPISGTLSFDLSIPDVTTISNSSEVNAISKKESKIATMEHKTEEEKNAAVVQFEIAEAQTNRSTNHSELSSPPFTLSMRPLEAVLLRNANFGTGLEAKQKPKNFKMSHLEENPVLADQKPKRVQNFCRFPILILIVLPIVLLIGLAIFGGAYYAFVVSTPVTILVDGTPLPTGASGRHVGPEGEPVPTNANGSPVDSGGEFLPTDGKGHHVFVGAAEPKVTSKVLNPNEMRQVEPTDETGRTRIPVVWPNGTLLATDSTGEYILDDGTPISRDDEGKPIGFDGEVLPTDSSGQWVLVTPEPETETTTATKQIIVVRGQDQTPLPTDESGAPLDPEGQPLATDEQGRPLSPAGEVLPTDDEGRYVFVPTYPIYSPVAWPNGTLLATDSTGEYILDDGTDYQRIRENLLPSLQDAVLRFDIWQCGQGWSHFNGSCYQPSYFQKHPFQQEVTFDEAERVCRNLAPGANLISIHSKEEQHFVHELVVEKSHNCWIGLRHLENKWIWNDGTKVDYTNWDAANGEPSNVNLEKWVYMRPNGGKWNNVKKDYKALIGCKKPVGKLA